MTLTFYIFVFCIFLCICLLKKLGIKTINGHALWPTDSFQIFSFNDGQCLFDYYVVAHISANIMYYILGLILNISNINLFVITLAIIFEIIENSTFIIQIFKSQQQYNDYQGESVVNMYGDVLVSVLTCEVLNYFNFSINNMVLIIFLLEYIAYLIIKDGIFKYIYDLIKKT